MIFTLEALEAKKGDALLLHWGDPEDPRLIVIDGGPGGVYSKSVKPRLEALRQARDPEEPLPVEILMVSHVDDDHVNGVLDLFDELVRLDEQERPLPWDVLRLWHNSFDDVLGNQGEELLASLGTAASPVVTSGRVPAGLPVERETALILASIAQGRRLRQAADRLGLLLNDPFRHPAGGGRPGLVRAPAEGRAEVELDGGLTLTVVGPSQERLQALQKTWDKDLKKILDKERKEEAAAAAFKDDSVPNLSSIVMVAEAEVGGETKRMLLTGDARGDFVLAGLEAAGFVAAGETLEVDVLKMPHHGSFHNVEDVFFRRLKADHYVISANGEHGNPDLPTLEMLSAERPDDDFTLWLTNREPRLEEFFAAERGRGRGYRVEFRDDPTPSFQVELGEPLGR